MAGCETEEGKPGCPFIAAELLVDTCCSELMRTLCFPGAGARWSVRGPWKVIVRRRELPIFGLPVTSRLVLSVDSRRPIVLLFEIFGLACSFA